MTIDQGDSHVEDGQIVYDYVYMVWKVNSVFTSHDKDNAEITEITQKYDFSLTNDTITATNSKGESITGEIIQAESLAECSLSWKALLIMEIMLKNC